MRYDKPLVTIEHKNGEALVMPTDTLERFAAAVAQAAALLRDGQVVALPTETVYGLAANALDAAAVARIYAAKGRPSHNPIIVHIDGIAMAKRYAQEWPEAAERLAAAFWPGPLTMVLPRAAGIPEIVTAGGPTVGIRWPAHPLMQAVITACGFPLAAPSANPSNHISPTTAAQVRANLGQRIPLIVDGGAAEVGIESTVVDLTSGTARVLRPGMISEADILAQLGAMLAVSNPVLIASKQGKETLRSPGQLKQHYSPKTRLALRRWQDEADLIRQVTVLGAQPDTVRVIAWEKVPAAKGWLAVQRLPPDPKGCARALYAVLHLADQPGTALIIVEEPPEGPAWKAVNDRLRRAAAQHN